MTEPADISRDLIQSLVRGLGVLIAVGEFETPPTLSEVAKACGLSRSAARRMLHTLAHSGLIEHDGHRFRLTSRVLDLGYVHLSRLPLPEVVTPHCKELAERIGRSVSVATLQGNEVVHSARAGSPGPMDISIPIGARSPAHTCSIGRVQLAWRSPQDIADFAASPEFVENPDPTVSDEEGLRSVLADIRGQGWAHNPNEDDTGLSTIAAPIRDRAGAVIAGIHIADHSTGDTGIPPLTKFVPDLLETAAAIGADLHSSHIDVASV